MQVEVLLFASLQDALGENKLTVTLPEPATVADLMASLRVQFPPLAETLDRIRVAVDHEFRVETDPVPAGAEVALIPPVSGG